MKLLEPGRIGNVETKNRVVLAAMGAHGLHEDDGAWGERYRAYYEARAAGGTGIITTETTFVSQAVEPFTKGLFSVASAKHLVDNKGVHRVDTMGTTYIHFMFDHHEVVLSNGAWTESFQPGDYSLKGVGNAQRGEIFELFPELETVQGLEDYTAARRTLKKHEAKMLLK